MRAVSYELERWRVVASVISDPLLRKDALDSLARKQDHAYGAALFWALPAKRDPRLLRLLVAYQTIWDLLDNVSERCPSEGRQLHTALVDGLDQSARHDSYYGPCTSGDGGYLDALVRYCQQACGVLPAYRLVRSTVRDGAARCAVQAVNHEPDRARREAALRRSADSSPNEHNLSWFELTAAASAYLPHPLLALAAEQSTDMDTVRRIDAAYFPWVALSVAMLDSYVDQAEDCAGKKHSYIAYYESPQAAHERIHEIVLRAVSEARQLPNGDRHAVLVEAMVAMYLSKKNARSADMRETSRQLLEAGGTTGRIIAPLARAWRALRD